MINNLTFDDCKTAFAYKTNSQLKKAHFLFASMGKPWLVNLGLQLTPNAIKWHVPFTKTIIRKTIFSQFVGGETLAQTAQVAATLNKYQVQVILDYGVEGKEGEENFDTAQKEFINVIDYAATQPNIPFISVKVTGFARFALLQKIDAAMQDAEGTLMNRYLQTIELLPPIEKEEWHRVRLRMMHICEAAHKKNISVLIDAEESWIQDPVDALTLLMMDVFNKSKAVIFNTIQLYRHDRLIFLKNCYDAADERNFILGAKLVRGAYMDKERKRAVEKNYASPIQPDKAACDRDYNLAVAFCINHLNKISIIVASHNEYSNLYAAQLMDEKGIPHRHEHVHFSQLYGMSDNITFNLAQSGFSVSKYLPFGPLADVIPYLMRRAQENSAVAGQTGRELSLIKKEIKRRKSST